jgi:hypothetical protein
MEVLKDKIDDFLNFLLDGRCQVRKEVITSRNWEVTIAPGRPNVMEVEWLADSISEFGFDTDVISINFEFCKIRESVRDLGAINRDSVADAAWEFIEKYTVLTNKKLDFLVYMDQSGDYFLCAGPKLFVAHSYKCSKDTAKFFDYIEDFGAEGKNKLSEVWQRYMNAPAY